MLRQANASTYISKLAISSVLALVALTACGAPTPGSPTPAPSQATPTPQAILPSPPPATATQASTAPPTLPQPTITPTEPQATPDPEAIDNIWSSILGATPAPSGWSVRPCPWQSAPFLCVSIGNEIIGSPEINIYSLQTHNELQQMLADAGLDPASVDYRDPQQAPRVMAALMAFVDNYHLTFEEDRRVTYGGTKTYSRLETQEIMMGDLPAVQYGFAVLNADGSVHERWLSYAGFDGDLLFVVVAPFYPDDLPGRFRSDEELQQFEPYLKKIIGGLKLPLPILDTDVKSLTALQEVQMHAAYTIAANPVGPIGKGETRTVNAQSPNGRWWRVDCTENKHGNCWVQADTKLVQPGAP
ncbi:MAG: hypothetical protein WCD37_03325 [Chloroflexia bacterium]